MILCSSNPLLIKNLYDMLRDAGHAVEAVEHPALAVKRVLCGGYDCVVVDAEPFGLSAEDAARIIRTIAPEMPIFSFGGEELGNPPTIKLPADWEAIKEMLHHSAA